MTRKISSTRSPAVKGKTSKPCEDEIRMRSYLIWEREGKPNGRAREHWLRAEAELKLERAIAPASAKRPATGSSKRSAGPAAGKTGPARRKPAQIPLEP